MSFRGRSLFLGAIIFVAFLIRVVNLNYNTPFLDEAIYIVLGKKILDLQIAQIAGSISWVGGFPFFYPLLSAIYYSVGGIFASRLLNVILGTTIVYFVYLFARSLKLLDTRNENKWVGFGAAMFMATSASAIYASRLAIYDTLGVFLFVISLIFLQKAIKTDSRQLYLKSAAILFLSLLAKYITLIFVPFFAIANFFLSKKYENNVKFFLFPLFLLILGYYYLNFESLNEFYSTQGVGLKTEVVEIFKNFTLFGYILAVVGSALIFKRQKFLVVSLLGLSFVPFIFHLISVNSSSVAQHAYFSLIFISPLVGALFAKMVKKHKLGFFLVEALVIANLYFSAQILSGLENFWPNSERAMSVLAAEIDSDDRILTESGDVTTLALYDRLSSENIFGPFEFSFKELEGYDAYSLALEEGFFNYVELDSTSFDQDTRSMIEEWLANKYYKIFDDGKIKIYRI